MLDNIIEKYNEGRLSLYHNSTDDNYRIWLYPPLSLSHTELEILYYLLLGKSVNFIANYRNRSMKTIWGQKKHIYEKLGIESDMTLYRDLILKRIVVIENN